MESFVRGLDRWRNVVALAVALVLTPLAMHHLAREAGLDWLAVQIVIGILLGAIVMLVTGTVLAVVIAILESHHVARAAAAERALPVARVLSRRWFARLRRAPRRRPDR